MQIELFLYLINIKLSLSSKIIGQFGIDRPKTRQSANTVRVRHVE